VVGAGRYLGGAARDGGGAMQLTVAQLTVAHTLRGSHQAMALSVRLLQRHLARHVVAHQPARNKASGAVRLHCQLVRAPP
jgi:hypothetical protein